MTHVTIGNSGATSQADEPLAVRRKRAAGILGLATRTFDRMVSSGQLPKPVYLGRIPVWRVEALRTWLAAREAGR